MKKSALWLIVALGLTGCGVNGSGTAGTPCGGNIDLDAINEYLENDPHWANMNNNGNKMTLIPFTHINGPKAEWNFFAFVNFEYNATTYYKYQVTYLSCTCRSAEVNYWQTAYVELSCPISGERDDVKLLTLSFEKDGRNGSGHYNAGFWGDSGTNGETIPGSKDVTYEDIRDGFIPFLVGKTYKELSSYDGFKVTTNGTTVTYDDTVFGIDPNEFAEDMAGVELDGKQVTLDYFNGASVSTNNIIRMLIPLMEYHADNNI